MNTDNTWKIIFFIIAAAFTAFWMFLFFYGKKKFLRMTKCTVDRCPFQEMAFIGMAFLWLIRFPTENSLAMKTRACLREVYGEDDPKVRYLILRGVEAMLLLTLLPLGFFLAIFSGKPIVSLLWILFFPLGVWYMESELKDRIYDHRAEILRQLPSALSKITLLVNSGMVLREAWELVAQDGEGLLYREMRRTGEDIANNMPEQQAYAELAERCREKEIRKLVMVITQNLVKGRTELTRYLSDLSKEIWVSRELSVKKRAADAHGKMMVPSFIIFVGIMIMAIVPMFSMFTF